MNKAEKIELLKQGIEIMHEVKIVRSRISEKALYAIPLGLSEDLVLLQGLDDFDLDGYLIIRLKDITSVEISKSQVFRLHILKEEGVLDQIKKPALSSLDHWKDVLEELSAIGNNIIVQCESLESTEFYIGAIIAIDKKSLYLLYFDAFGEWDEEPTEISLRDITSVQIDSRYCTIISKYLSPRIIKDKQLEIHNLKERTRHLWRIKKWEKTYGNIEVRSGLRLYCDKEVDPEVKRACKEFCTWLRSEYYFPIRVPIYLKSTEKIKKMDGDLVYGTFFGPYIKLEEPYIRVATGDFHELQEECGKDEALAAYLSTIAHELSHYFQWLNDLKMTEIGKERQADKYSRDIVREYARMKEHP